MVRYYVSGLCRGMAAIRLYIAERGKDKESRSPLL